VVCAISQVFVEAKAGSEGDELERELYILRKMIEKEKTQKMGADAADFYVASLSDKTIVYKVGAAHGIVFEQAWC
jgi:glutamate synthase domain-containing protein 1